MKNLFIIPFCFLSFVACKKEEEPAPAPSVDKVAPVITLNGKQQDTVLVLNTYLDPGASATDDKDGNISSRIVVSGTVNSSIPGTVNTLTYSVTDLAGNAATPVIRNIYVKPATAIILAGQYQVACASSTQNPGVDPIVSANNTYSSSVQLSGQTLTLVSMTALNIGPLTTNTGILGINSANFSLPFSPVNAPGLSFAFCTGTVSPSKTSFTIDTKYYDTMYPNKFYEARNVFTKQ